MKEDVIVKEITVQELQLDPRRIGGDWMLITAGTQERGYNTMTASWGHVGSIWGHGQDRLTSAVYVRPQRYTKAFVDREELYALSFFPAQYREALAYLGSHSGRDGDKVAAAGLTPVYGEGYTTFAEADLTLVCRKLYRQTLQAEGFLDAAVLERQYPQRDFHDMYIGEVVKILVPDDAEC